MSNSIGFSKAVFGKENLSMSNQGTDCFLELLEMAAAENDMTDNQRKLIGFLISYGIVILIMLTGNYGMNLYVILALPSVIILHFLWESLTIALTSGLSLHGWTSFRR